PRRVQSVPGVRIGCASAPRGTPHASATGPRRGGRRGSRLGCLVAQPPGPRPRPADRGGRRRARGPLPPRPRGGATPSRPRPRRAAAAMKKREDKLPAERLEVRDADVVETAEFTARGRIDGGQLRVRSRYFGESVLRLTDVRTLRAIGGTAAAEVTVDAALYA